VQLNGLSSVYGGVDHLGIAVRDLAQAKATYEGVLGFRVSGEETLEARGLHIAFVETGGSRIELIAPLHPKSEISAFLDKRGEGLHHVCVRVADLTLALAHIKAQGGRLIDEAPRPGAHGTRVAFVHPKSTHGVLLELVEHHD